MQFNRKKIIITVIIFIFLITANSLVFREYLEDYTRLYLGIVLMINLLVSSFLSYTAFYASRVNINPRYMSIAFFTYMLGINLMICVLLLIGEPNVDYVGVEFFLTLGRIFFLVGIASSILLEEKGIFERISYLKLGFFSIFLILLGNGVKKIVFEIFLISKYFVPIFHIIYLLGLMLLLLELLLNEKRKPSRVIIIALLTIFISQFYLSVQPLSALVLIQGLIIHALAMILFSVEIHEINVLIPEQKNLELQKQFNIYSKYLKKIIDKKTLQVRDVNQKIIDELEYAKIIQQSLLPNNKITHRDVSFTSAYYPCERLSGDFYDIYSIDDDNVALYLLDVAGHGISAALMTMLSNNYLKSNDKLIKKFRGMHPDKNLKYFYEQFNRMNFPDEIHMVLFYATLDLNSKVLTYCSGGMNCNPIRFRANGKVEYLDQSKGFPICKLEGLFTPEYHSETIQLQKGDRILFYTDGLTDKEKNGIFNMSDIIELFVMNRNLSSREINQMIVEKINLRSSILNDDITYIIMDV